MMRDWQTDDVMTMAKGYQASCVLFAAAELDLFGRIGGHRLTAAEIADRLQADPRGTTVLLDALVALELLSKDGCTYAVPESVADLLVADGRNSILAMIRHHANCMRRWSQLAGVVTAGHPATRLPSIRGEEADHQAFIGAMHDINRLVAPRIVSELGMTDFHHLLDVGGASGTWTMAWLDLQPDATATLFDLPAVIPQAATRLERAGYLHRVRLVAGDFAVDSLPGGADLAWVSAIVHQNSPAENQELFARVWTALVAGGRIAVRDIVMDESHVHPVAGALFAVNMLVGTPGGGTYSFNELRAALESAGFEEVEWVRREESMHSVVVARKPGRRPS